MYLAGNYCYRINAIAPGAGYGWQGDGTTTICHSDVALNFYTLVKPPAKDRKSGSIEASASRNSGLALPKTVKLSTSNLSIHSGAIGLDIRLLNLVKAPSLSSKISISVALDLSVDKNHSNREVFISSNSNVTRLLRSVIHDSRSSVLGMTAICRINVMVPSSLFSIN